MRIPLQVGMISKDGKVEIIGVDTYCYVVAYRSNKSYGIRTLSKHITEEFTDYISQHPQASSMEAREALKDISEYDNFEYGYNATFTILANMALNPDRFLQNASTWIAKSQSSPLAGPLDEPLQLIFYGAPGTGKSYTIDRMASEERTVRTTFHPDSDYASFVGAYKPTMQSLPISYISDGLAKYARAWEKHDATEQKIVYKYVPQAFLKAYVAAWSNLSQPQFLVIEEINRGNCAQIFGDLFQLLDRNNTGCSAYAIHADEDIAQFLAGDAKGFANLSEEQRADIRDFVLTKDSGEQISIGNDILAGKKLLLPPNLYIWATMNTSDQSLFPIDSAFKRRWNWRYMPIDYTKKNYTFLVGNKRYSWGEFLRKINPIISELTESPDKQMGYFFAKPDTKSSPAALENDTISEEVFVNKVLFYLWTDVLKDYDAGETFLNADTGRTYEFSDFFDTANGYLQKFIDQLALETIGPEFT